MKLLGENLEVARLGKKIKKECDRKEEELSGNFEDEFNLPELQTISFKNNK